jgi:hypothetical protein
MRPKIKLQMVLVALIATTFLLACNATASIPTRIAPLIATLAPSLPVPLSTSTDTPQPTPIIKCPNGDCANVCISKLTSVLQASNVPLSPPRVANPRSLEIHPTTLVTYPINGDQLGSPTFAANLPSDLIPYEKDTTAQQKIWQYFSTIIPADQRTELTHFIISTDGKGGMLAAVEQSSDSPRDWALNVDIVDASSPRNLTFTLIHEFGHLLTLNDTQVTPDVAVLSHPNDMQIYQQEAAACPQYFTDVGCSQPNSYINQFFQEFWPKLYPEWSQINAEKDQSVYLSLLARFYRSHPTQFVSPYAATSPEEDIAESWAHFVLMPKPAPDSIASRKVLFFYNFPELVQLRNQIIYGICNYAFGQ